jgi:enterochelin esterase family protein
MPPPSYVELPDAPPQPYFDPRDGVPAGTIEREDLVRDPFGEGRRIWTYLPPGYDPAAGPYPLLLQFDGIASRKLGLHTTLDNMIAEGVIPPVVCVMMHNLDRMVELPCNETFADWLAGEFLPMWRSKYAITDDPAVSIVTGMSYGGLGAAWCGFRHAGVFGNVLSQSGSFWWGPEGSGTWQWLTAQFEASPRLPLRFFMNVGLLEDGVRPGDPTYPSMVEANRALRDVLMAKGNEVYYDEFNGGHDYVSWRGSIADGLRVLLGKKD